MKYTVTVEFYYDTDITSHIQTQGHAEAILQGILDGKGIKDYKIVEKPKICQIGDKNCN